MADTSRSGAESLSPEQHRMWKARHREEIKALNDDDKKAFNKKLRAQLDAMSEAELARTKTALQGEWDKLPADKKKKIADRIAEKGDNAAD